MQLFADCGGRDANWSKRGSSIVEAAVVFPLVALIVIGVIYTGMSMYQSVRSDAEYHESAAHQEKMLYPEDILRAEWLLSKGFKVEDKE